LLIQNLAGASWLARREPAFSQFSGGVAVLAA